MVSTLLKKITLHNSSFQKSKHQFLKHVETAKHFSFGAPSPHFRLVEVAVFLDRSAHGGHLTEVGHQGRPVSDAEGATVDRGTAGVGREGEVGGNPEDRREEPWDLKLH